MHIAHIFIVSFYLLYPLRMLTVQVDQSFFISSYVADMPNPAATQGSVTQEAVTQAEDIQEAEALEPKQPQEPDYTSLNKHRLFEQYAEQPLYDLTKVAPEAAILNIRNPIVDYNEAMEIDFNFFNDPYAFKKYRNLPVKAKFQGYIQHSAWWDQRQVLSGGDGYALVYPLNKQFDVDCHDINARGQFFMSIIQTRTRIEFFGPKILGGETWGYIETDLWGNIPIQNRFHVRHAFFQLTWPKTKLLLGQFWNPVFLVKTFPLALNFGGGTPTEVAARNPQICIAAYPIKGAELLFVACTELEFLSNGPIGYSSTYQRNSRFPELAIRGSYETEHTYTGICLDFLRLKPRLESNKGFKVHESINSIRVVAFNTLKFYPWEIRNQFNYVQNPANIVGLGGFAVSSVNPTTDERMYVNLNSVNYWVDVNLAGKIEPGIFAAFSKNIGARQNIIQCIFDPATGQEETTIYPSLPESDQIDTLFRISARVRCHFLPVDFDMEIEYDRVMFGCINNRGRVDNASPVTNMRLMFSTFLYF